MVPNDVIYYLQLCNLWWKELCVWGGAVWLVGGASKRGVGTKDQYAFKTVSVLSNPYVLAGFPLHLLMKSVAVFQITCICAFACARLENIRRNLAETRPVPATSSRTQLHFS